MTEQAQRTDTVGHDCTGNLARTHVSYTSTLLFVLILSTYAPHLAYTGSLEQ